MNYPIISVVTVSYNTVATIEQTILSVINQTYPNIEYIIIDGGSTDGTIEIIKKYENRIHFWISEPDNGIYDAMNKGIDKATGQWINFMNAGDCFHDNKVLESLFGENNYDNCIVIYGNTNLVKNGLFVGRFLNNPFWKVRYPFRTGQGFCHQSLFTKTSLVKKLRFDLSYKYAADFAMSYRLYLLGYNFEYINLVIADYDMTGVSSQSRYLIIREFGKVLGCEQSIMYKLYCCIFYIKQILNL